MGEILELQPVHNGITCLDYSAWRARNKLMGVSPFVTGTSEQLRDYLGGIMSGFPLYELDERKGTFNASASVVGDTGNIFCCTELFFEDGTTVFYKEMSLVYLFKFNDPSYDLYVLHTDKNVWAYNVKAFEAGSKFDIPYKEFGLFLSAKDNKFLVDYMPEDGIPHSFGNGFQLGGLRAVYG